MAPASAAAVRQFAEERGEPVDDSRRFSMKRRHRFLVRLSKALRFPGLARGLAARRRALIHFEPEFGSLLLRWAVTVVRPRYATAGSASGDEPSGAPGTFGATSIVRGGSREGQPSALNSAR
jgi:hypothetical protein